MEDKLMCPWIYTLKSLRTPTTFSPLSPLEELATGKDRKEGNGSPDYFFSIIFFGDKAREENKKGKKNKKTKNGGTKFRSECRGQK
jgi:hypothetical protein